MTEQFTNGAQTTLNGAINNSTTSLTVTSAAGFPTSGDFRIIIAAEGGNKDEILLVTGVSGTTFTVTRAYEAISDGTQVAQSHSNGATLAHVLTAGSLRAAGLPQGFIGASVFSNATTNIGNASFDPVTFTNEDFDTDSFHDNSTNTSRMTIPAGLGGEYLIQGNVEWDTNATGDRIVCIFKNGSDTSRGWTRDDATVIGLGQPVVVTLNLVAGDYVELRAYQNSGTTRTVGGNGRTNLSIVKLDSGKVGSGIGVSVSGTSTALSNGSYTSLAFESADIFDTDGFHNPSSNNTRLTIPTGLGGQYFLSIVCSWPVTAGTLPTDLRVAYRVDGGTDVILWRRYQQVPNSSVTHFQQASVVVALNAGQYVEVRQYVDVTGETTAQYSAQLMRLDSGSTSIGVPARAEVPAATTYSTTSTSFVAINSSLDLAINVGASGRVWVQGVFNCKLSTASDVDIAIGVGVDADGATHAGGWAATQSTPIPVGFGLILTGISSGPHTLKVYWKTSSNTLSIPGTTRGEAAPASWWMALPL